MYKGALLLIPATFIGCGLAFKKYLENNELAECENFSVSGDLALKNIEKEKADNKENIEKEIKNLENVQESLSDWENSNFLNKIFQKPPVRNTKWYRNTPDIRNLEDDIGVRLEKLKEKLNDSGDIETENVFY